MPKKPYALSEDVALAFRPVHTLLHTMPTPSSVVSVLSNPDRFHWRRSAPHELANLRWRQRVQLFLWGRTHLRRGRYLFCCSVCGRHDVSVPTGYNETLDCSHCAEDFLDDLLCTDTASDSVPELAALLAEHCGSPYRSSPVHWRPS